ncbi:MAG TPA: hypothetical protein VNR68_01660 [Sphingomicrobium sp.]|nr:hypothetical protein [Sphingomicrobium sp.]
METPQNKLTNSDRRSFLTNFGKAAVVAPPVVTALLSTSLSSPAIAASTGGSVSSAGFKDAGNKGNGKGGFNAPQMTLNPKASTNAGNRQGLNRDGK